MRVLILTHPRSGGMSLLQFITLTLNSQKEFNYQMYHEPFGNNMAGLSNKDINKKLLVEDNIVVKDFPFHIISRDYNLNDIISKFDKVIIHERDNHKDVAISLLYIQENDATKIHKTYKVSDEWVKDNEDNIHQMIKDTEQMYNDIQNISCDNCLRTSYDGLYNNKSDIPRLLSFLNIYSSLYLDVLDNRHRLQNGDIGMDDVKVKRKLI
jgi:hypothetical protein